MTLEGPSPLGSPNFRDGSVIQGFWGSMWSGFRLEIELSEAVQPVETSHPSYRFGIIFRCPY